MKQTHPEKTFCGMVEGIQYGRGISSIRWKIFSTDVSHHQYEGGASSVQWRACSMDLSYHQYRGGCAVNSYQNCSRGSWWLYLSVKMIFYRQPMLFVPSNFCTESVRF